MKTALTMMFACGFWLATVTVGRPVQTSQKASTNDVARVLSDWHAAAAAADEERYFSALTEDSIFLGTDATERWTKAQFRQYAHPFFAKGKAWSFHAVRRDISFSRDRTVAWFDEDLDTPNLGPSRGSGVLVLERGVWRIAQYNLSVPIPNDVFKDVKQIVEKGTRPPKNDGTVPKR
jgi:SnoaL-like domain